MGVNRPSVAGETSFPLQYARSKKHKALSSARSLGLLALSFFALMLIPDEGWSQQRGPSALSQQGGQSSAHRLYARAKENPAITATPAITAAPAIEPTSPLGQALASCDKDDAVQETFALPGLKGEVTLDRCYKGHDHLICVFNALITERNLSRTPIRRSLTRNIQTSITSRTSVT
jgi:hypothetical protein